MLISIDWFAPNYALVFAMKDIAFKNKFFCFDYCHHNIKQQMTCKSIYMHPELCTKYDDIFTDLEKTLCVENQFPGKIKILIIYYKGIS